MDLLLKRKAKKQWKLESLIKKLENLLEQDITAKTLAQSGKLDIGHVGSGKKCQEKV